MMKALPQQIALLCAIIPVISVHTTWLIASMMENLHWCLPYWHSCHSISATGRQYPEFFVFKAIMLPLATLMFGYWLLLNHWLKQLFASKALRRTVFILGGFACVALILYTVTLGAVGDSYRLARRIGIVLFFVGTSFAHLVLVKCLNDLPERAKHYSSLISPWLKRMTIVCAALVIGSMINGLLGFLWEYWDIWENAFEWSYSLVMVSLFYLVGRMWSIHVVESHCDEGSAQTYR
jgi:hypothetical protein